MSRVLVIDSYDSFVYNLVQYLGELGADPIVVRNDAVTVDEAVALQPDAVLLSPGPGRPESSGIICDAIGAFAATGTPLLGVCLGHQAIGHVYGATVGALYAQGRQEAVDPPELDPDHHARPADLGWVADHGALPRLHGQQHPDVPRSGVHPRRLVGCHQVALTSSAAPLQQNTVPFHPVGKSESQPCGFTQFVHRSGEKNASIVQRGDLGHVVETVSWGRRILVWGHRQPQLHTTDVAPIPAVHLSELTGGCRRWWHRRHAPQQCDTTFPQDVAEEDAEADPDEGRGGGHDTTLPG